MKNTSGRPVDLSGIDISEIKDWMKSNNYVKNVIKCQSIISLDNENSMQNVCNVLGITRETVRLWKEQLRAKGLTGLLLKKKVGKRARIEVEKLQEIKKLIKQKPSKYGYEKKKWTGKLIVDYVKNKWNIKIGIRTAQLWLKQIR